MRLWVRRTKERKKEERKNYGDADVGKRKRLEEYNNTHQYGGDKY